MTVYFFVFLKNGYMCFFFDVFRPLTHLCNFSVTVLKGKSGVHTNKNDLFVIERISKNTYDLKAAKVKENIVFCGTKTNS